MQVKNPQQELCNTGEKHYRDLVDLVLCIELDYSRVLLDVFNLPAKAPKISRV